MPDDFPFPLATTDWLAANLSEKDVRVIDASWRMPGGAPAVEDYLKRRVRGAVFFDIDAIADRSSGLPHMLPSPAAFAAAAGALGISEADRVVVYDDSGVFSAARVWWTFRAMGHARVCVLDGGLPKWLREGRPVDDAGPARGAAHYRAQAPRRLARTHEDVRAALAAKSPIVLDARPASRFSGAAPEPRPGLRRGHMPGAVSLPYSLLLSDDGTMKPAPELRALFAARGVDDDCAVIATCGSGVTAAVIALALEVIGATDVGLYDGSWAEWGRATNDLVHFAVAEGADV